MPRQRTAETHLNNITAYLTQAVTFLDELNAAFGSSFVQQISKTILSLITTIQARDFIFHVLGDGSPEYPECEEEPT
jgi:hypothetical protein